ncbi:hypothetical protein FOZ62_009793, partial [Perkinsus olseni]
SYPCLSCMMIFANCPGAASTAVNGSQPRLLSRLSRSRTWSLATLESRPSSSFLVWAARTSEHRMIGQASATV